MGPPLSLSRARTYTHTHAHIPTISTSLLVDTGLLDREKVIEFAFKENVTVLTPDVNDRIIHKFGTTDWRQMGCVLVACCAKASYTENVALSLLSANRCRADMDAMLAKCFALSLPSANGSRAGGRAHMIRRS